MADTAARVHLLRPVRVLVCGDDETFVSRAAGELLRLGFEVVSATGPAKFAELAVAERVNVVVLDVSGGVTAAVATAFAVDALRQRIGVVLAGPAQATTGLGYPAVEFGAPAEELAAEVHSAFRGGPARAERSARR